MSDFLPDPLRWKERLDQSNLAEREAGRAIRLMREPEPLPGSQLARIAAHIRAARPRRRYFWVTVTAALLLGGATVASAAHLNVLPTWLTRMVRPKPTENTVDKRASLGPSRRAPAAMAGGPRLAEVNLPPVVVNPEAPPEPKPLQKALGGRPSSPQASQKSFVQPGAIERPSIPLMEPAPFEPRPLSQRRTLQTASLDRPAQTGLASNSTEDAAKYLNQAIRALRIEHSPSAALSLLDRHATVLAKSTFTHEALLLRVEAMLELNRKSEVLRLLDSATLTDVAASRALLVTRGELRSEANRCADGIGDFNRVLAESRQPDWQALLGRARCRNQLGDVAGARADAERYRHDFPSDPRLHDLEKQVGLSP